MGLFFFSPSFSGFNVLLDLAESFCAKGGELALNYYKS